MVSVDAIQKAIAAHTGWKARLRTAVASGKFEVEAGLVRVDNRCDFGKWLYGADLSAAEKESEHYRTVKRLHAQFHEEAAKVVQWATSGEKDKAEQAISMQGTYGRVSHSLTDAMVKWRESVR